MGRHVLARGYSIAGVSLLALLPLACSEGGDKTDNAGSMAPPAMLAGQGGMPAAPPGAAAAPGTMQQPMPVTGAAGSAGSAGQPMMTSGAGAAGTPAPMAGAGSGGSAGSG